MECGVLTPLFLFLYGVRCFDIAFVFSLARQRAQKKKNKNKKRNKSGVKTPHSIKKQKSDGTVCRCQNSSRA
jgi:hypothetical protein